MTILAIVGWLLLVVAASAHATRYLTIASQPVIVVATFAPYLSVASLASLTLFWLAGSAWGIAFSLTIVTLAVGAQVRPFVRRRPAFLADSHLTVMTCNVYFGRGDAAQILDVARTSDVDVLALQEITPELVDALARLGIADRFPYSVLAPAPLWAGAALWSRFPLREARIEAVDQLYRVSARVGLAADPSEDDPAVSSLHIHAPWPPAPGPWIDQLHALRDELKALSGPCIVMGDFNASIDHAPFRGVLSAGCLDATATSRSWPALTYPDHLRLPALIAIDHVLTRGWLANQAHFASITGTDHRAVIARLAPYPT
jgi:endonuclease/exonuclease/phosphatase (EEP) superfamily protein YafD